MGVYLKWNYVPVLFLSYIYNLSLYITFTPVVTVNNVALVAIHEQNLQQRLRRIDHRFGGDAKLFVDSRGRGGGAKAISANGLDRILGPAKGGGRFDGNSALAVGRDDRLSVRITLFFEQFPAWHGDNTNLLAFRRERFASLARQLQFSTSGH